MFKDICGSCGMEWKAYPNNNYCCSYPVYQPNEEYLKEDEEN